MEIEKKEVIMEIVVGSLWSCCWWCKVWWYEVLMLEKNERSVLLFVDRLKNGDIREKDGCLESDLEREVIVELVMDVLV